MPVLIEHIKTNLMSEGPVVVVSPDAGGVERARAYAKRVNATVAMIDKRRTAPNEAKAMNVVGDVKDRVAVVLDDMIDTAGTLVAASQAVLDAGAKKVYACATHGLFSGPAIERLEKSIITQVMITDTIPLPPAAQKSKKISQLSVAKILADAILRIQSHDSLSTLFI